MAYNFITAQEAAEMIKNGDTIGLSGFTAPGVPKSILEEVAHKAAREHEQGREFKVNIFTGASTSDHVDGILARNNAINMRAPYQNTPDLRKRINAHDTQLSTCVPPTRTRPTSASASTLTIPTTSTVISPRWHRRHATASTATSTSPSSRLPPSPKTARCSSAAAWATSPLMLREPRTSLSNSTRHCPTRSWACTTYISPPILPIAARYPSMPPTTAYANDRIGRPTLKIDPSKVRGIVRTNMLDGVKPFTKPDAVSEKIGANVVQFLISEYRKGRIPKEFLPLQSGVGNVANAVLHYLCMDKELPSFMMYTEVVQDSVLELLRAGKCKFASTCSMTFSDEVEKQLFADLDFFHDKILMRPAEISNNPEVIRRLGVIAMNTALEADIFGCVNSTHVLGTRMMNGIGGSGDFTRNAYISIFSCPSVTKEGLISNIVPMVSHADHSEHSVDILITDQGIADLRAKDPEQRAHEIIENCAHPDYRPLLRDFLKLAKGGQTPTTLQAAYAFHTAFANTGDMHNVDFSKFA